MTRTLTRTLLLAGALCAAGAACGDDGTVVGDLGGGGGGGGGGATTTDPTILASTGVTGQADAALSISITAVNPSDVALSWSVSSTTLADLATAATLTGTNLGATLSWTPSTSDVGSHVIEFTATFGETGTVSSSVEVTVSPKPCFYPGQVGFARGLTFPDYAWNAVLADGTPYDLDMYDIYCDDERYGQYDTIIFLISTVWCPNCPRYIAWIDALAPRLEEEGAMIIFLDVQDAQGGPSTTAIANPHFSAHSAHGVGIRAGDADNTVEPNGVLQSPLIEYFPTSFVVRRSDMKVIADQRDTDSYLPLVEIAMDPDADWSSPPAPTIIPEFPANCGEEDEESYEPNNDIPSAGQIGVGSFDGGICGANNDFYYVDVEGEWTITIEFNGSEGDLDMALTDDQGQPLEVDGEALISQGTTGTETLTYTGPAYAIVYGYNNATTTYTLSITQN
ncbi:MAG: hypothetical protein H6698_02850 [Myxococcales bacterium]|nr:hypothetical protein [Myxococcales bacterium]MCB9533253.1 hypothetical protein [Myxococcales bacterium]